MNEKKTFKSQVGVGANVRLTVYRPDGSIKQVAKGNLTVSAGLEWIKEHAHDSADGTNIMEFVEVGTSSQAVAAGDTTLIAYTSGNGLDRALGTYASGATGVCTVTKSFSVTGTVAIEECGLFGVVTANTVPMLARVLTGTVTVNNGDTLEVVWTVTYTST